MSVTNTFKASVKIGDVIYLVERDMTAYEVVVNELDIDLAPAKSGSLTTRTNNSDGTLTMSTGHGITTGARLDLYWATGSRRGITVGTVSGNSVPISSGTGDNLPTAATAITAMVPTLQAVPTTDCTTFTAWGTRLIKSNGEESDQQGTFVLGHGTFTEDAVVKFNYPSTGVWNGTACWNDSHMESNPLAAATAWTKVYVSHGDPDRTLTFQFGAGVA